MTQGTLQSQEMSILAPSGFRRVCAENKRLLLWNDAYPPTFSCQAQDALHRIYGGRTMASWVGAERKSRSLKELDVGDLYDQLESMGAYLKELTSGFGKTTSRQFGRARDVVADTAHDAEATMKDNLAASLILAVGLGMIIGYMIRRSSE
jgi:hypothetical protein